MYLFHTFYNIIIGWALVGHWLGASWALVERQLVAGWVPHKAQFSLYLRQVALTPNRLNLSRNLESHVGARTVPNRPRTGAHEAVVLGCSKNPNLTGESYYKCT